MRNTENINITVTGADKEKKDVVSNIVSKALVSEGFTNVALVTANGEPMAGSDVPSVLDAIKAKDPSFLETPINIWADEPVGEAIVKAIVGSEGTPAVVIEDKE